MGVILVEDYHAAADIVSAADADSSALREYGFEEESAVEFIQGTTFGRPELGEIKLDPLALAMGISIGVVARARVAP